VRAHECDQGVPVGRPIPRSPTGNGGQGLWVPQLPDQRQQQIAALPDQQRRQFLNRVSGEPTQAGSDHRRNFA
jgi:hypothetical protein